MAGSWEETMSFSFAVADLHGSFDLLCRAIDEIERRTRAGAIALATISTAARKAGRSSSGLWRGQAPAGDGFASKEITKR
jgi:hypothetical protein